jgi:hypothetical protein
VQFVQHKRRKRCPQAYPQDSEAVPQTIHNRGSIFALTSA